jgi:hypothetical protein
VALLAKIGSKQLDQANNEQRTTNGSVGIPVWIGESGHEKHKFAFGRLFIRNIDYPHFQTKRIESRISPPIAYPEMSYVFSDAL